VSCPYSRNGETHAGLACGATVNGVFQPRPSANDSSYNKFTPRATIRYEIQPGTNVYASYSMGFRSGEWNSVIPVDNPALWKANGQVGQESVNAFELGVKHAGNRLHFEAAGFLL
jgi:iron complex outermembrane receptor protein